MKHDDDDDDDEKDWGYAPKKSGVSSEAKIGLVLVLVVAAVFGFVYYKKSTAPKSLLDAAAADGDDAPAATTTVTAKKDANVEPAVEETDDPFSKEVVPTKHARKKPPARDDFAQDEPSDDVASGLFQPPPGRTTRGASPPPADSDNPFEGAPAQTHAARPPSRPQGSDPFGSVEPQEEPETAGVPAAEEVDDPFSAPARVRATAPAAPDEFEPIEQTQVTGFNDPPARATASPVRGAAPVSPSPFPPARAAPPRGVPTQAGFPRGIPPQRGVAPAAPIAGSRPPINQPLEHAADDFQRPVVSTARPRSVGASPFGASAAMTTIAAAPGPVAGGDRAPVYEVQPNDNFWKISAAQYGTPKYFQALAQYNSDRIPDPTKLRPGMKVVTPAADVLEAKYPTLFPRSASAAALAGTTGSEQAAVSGMFVAANGQPMYRIGKNDSLNTIARDHLGRSTRWIQIFEMNRDQLKTPNDLKLGAVLRLPLDASAVRVVQQPGTIR